MSALTERELAQAAAFIEQIDQHHKAGDVAAAGAREEDLLELRGWVRQPDGYYRDTTGCGATFQRHSALRSIRLDVHRARQAIAGAMRAA